MGKQMGKHRAYVHDYQDLYLPANTLCKKRIIQTQRVNNRHARQIYTFYGIHMKFNLSDQNSLTRCRLKS